MKHIRRAGVLLFAMLLLAAPVRAEDGMFKDVPSTHWAYENIRLASRYGLVGGMGDGYFGIGQQVTRAQYALMLCRLMGWELISPEEGSFDDNQDAAQWYYSAIETVYAHGALLKLGASAGVNEPLPREEMAAMTVRALGYAALSGLVQDDCPFSDVSTNRGYITMAYHMGFMGGVGGNAFSPRTASTREQAATVLLRVYTRMHAAVTQASIETLPDGAPAVYAEPILDTGGRIPMTPRAPLESVYDAAVRAGAGGAVALYTTPYDATRGVDITPAELSAYLEDETVRVYRSARYGSSYLVHTGPDGGTVVWYETAEDIAQKTALCRLLGVKTVYLT